MPSRKRRSNRLTAEQLQEKRDLRECQLNQLTTLIAFGQEHQEVLHSCFRSVSLRTAMKMCADGEAEHFEAQTENGMTVFFRELVPFKGVQYSLPTMPNVASAEAMAGYSPVAKLSGREMRRVEHILAWPFVGDTKAPLVAPRVSDRDREAARKLFLATEGKRPATAGHCYRKAA